VPNWTGRFAAVQFVQQLSVSVLLTRLGGVNAREYTRDECQDFCAAFHAVGVSSATRLMAIRPIWEDVIEILSQINVQSPARFDDGSDGGHLRSGLLAANMQPILAPKYHGPHRAFAPVIVNFEAAILQKFFQPAPLAQCVVTRFGQGSARLRLLPSGYQPFLERGHHGTLFCWRKAKRCVASRPAWRASFSIA